MALSTLPDVCLLKIFSNLPLQDLFHVSHVCTRWSALFSSACIRHQSITILLSRNKLDSVLKLKSKVHFPEIFENLVYSRLHFTAELNSEIVDWFVDVFPNVTRLYICVDQIEMNFEICNLLNSLNNSKLLTLHIWSRFNTTEFNLNPLFESINSLESLKFLSLEFWNVIAHLDLQVLNHLNVLQFYSQDSADILYDSLIQYATHNRNLTQIRLRNQIVKSNSVDAFLKIEPVLARKMTDLSFNHQMVDLEAQFAPLCSLFSSLRFFAVKLGYLTLVELVPHLVRLEHLDHIGVHIDFMTFIIGGQNDVVDYGGHTLPQIRTLSLRVWTVSHQNLESLNFGRLFPNLETVRLYNDSNECRDCSLYRNLNGTVNKCGLKECLQEIVKPLKCNEKLKKILNEYEQEEEYRVLFVRD